MTPYRTATPSKPNRFTHAMTLRTDEELIAIVGAAPGEWEPEAIDAAHVELEQRKLSLEHREVLHDELARTQDKAERPLHAPARALAFAAGVFLLPVFLLPGLLVLSIARHYRKLNEHRRAREVMQWFAYGVATLIGGSVFYAGCS